MTNPQPPDTTCALKYKGKRSFYKLQNQTEKAHSVRERTQAQDTRPFETLLLDLVTTINFFSVAYKCSAYNSLGSNLTRISLFS